MHRELSSKSNHTTKSRPTSRAIVGGISAAWLLVALAGCASSQEKWTRAHNFNANDKAALADVTLDPVNTQGKFTTSHYHEAGSQLQLPHDHVAEATTFTAAAEARRASAQSALVVADANNRELTAGSDALMHGAVRDHQAQNARTGTIRSVYDAELDEMGTQVTATEHSIDAESTRRGQLLDATMQEWSAQLNTMRGDTETQFSQAQARHQQMVSERAAFEDKGQANIDKMKQIAEFTQNSAAAQVRDLRQQATSTTDQTASRVAEYDAKIKALREHTEANVSSLKQRSTSLRESSAANVAELRAHAKLLEEQNAGNAFELDVQSAETFLASKKAEADELFTNSEALSKESIATVGRLRSDAERFMSQSKTDHADAVDSVGAFVEKGKAGIALMRVNADKIETVARAEFIKAEAEAIANAEREQAAHQVELAEAEFERIRAQAEAEAARIKAEFQAQFAEQQKKGKITMPNKQEGIPGQPNAGEENPTFAKAPSKPAVVEPDRVADFKTALAKAAQLRTDADAEDRNLFATADERKTKFDAWYAQQIAKHTEMVAEADTLERTSRTDVARMVVQSEKLLADATAQYEDMLANANSDKETTFAQILSLTAQAGALEKKAAAEIMQLDTQASVTERNGASEVKSLVVMRESTAQRGSAKSAELVAEADAMQNRAEAIAMQMDQEILAATQVLNSELARLDQSAQSFIQVAEAQRNEGFAMAEAFERITSAKAHEIAAANRADTMVAQADVEFMNTVRGSHKVNADAAIAKAIAETEAELKQFVAQDMMRRASIEAEMRIAKAAADEQFIIADADDLVTNSVFSARIAQTQADRNRTYADQYMKSQHAAARSISSDAHSIAFSQQASEALAELSRRVAEFERQAQENWDAQLALPVKYGEPATNQALVEEAGGAIEESFADVPVTED